MGKKPPKSSSQVHDNPISADGMAMVADMSHAAICFKRLSSSEFDGDVSVEKALYQSGLISFRRCIGGDARSMRKEAPGGGVTGKIGMAGLGDILDADLSFAANDMYRRADDHVAHRQYLEGERFVTADVDEQGGNRLSDHWAMPDNGTIDTFANVSNALKAYLLQRTAEAMTSSDSGQRT